MKKKMMQKPDIAILDGDILIYKAAFWADTEGIEDLESRLKLDIENWTPDGVSKIYLARSCSRYDNFRRQILPSYKANRDTKPAPESLGIAKEILEDIGPTRNVSRIEADDLMGMGASSGKAIAVTIDKDLRGVTGWHWNPEKEAEPIFISEEEADKFFACQLITGDVSDNITGLFRKGKHYFEKNILPFDPEDWWWEIWWAYEEAGNDMDFFLSQARCLRILRDGEYDKDTNKIKLWDLPDRYAL